MNFNRRKERVDEEGYRTSSTTLRHSQYDLTLSSHRLRGIQQRFLSSFNKQKNEDFDQDAFLRVSVPGSRRRFDFTMFIFEEDKG